MLKKTKKLMTLIEEITDKERLITDELKGLMINKDQKSRSKEIERCN